MHIYIYVEQFMIVQVWFALVLLPEQLYRQLLIEQAHSANVEHQRLCVYRLMSC